MPRNDMSDDIRKTVREGNSRGRKSSIRFIIRRIIVFLLIIAAVMAIVFFIKNRKVKIEDGEISKYNYFLMTENEKNGIIDRNGNIIIEAKYDYIQIPNPEKGIFVCLYDYDSNLKLYKSTILNEKGEEIYKNYSNITAIPSNNTSKKSSYQTAILKYYENGKYGILTIGGKKVTNAIYESIETLDYKDGVLKIKKDEKYGLIEFNGTEIIKPQYDSIIADGYYSENEKYKQAGYIVSKRTDNGYVYGYISYTGKELLECKYSNLKRITNVKNETTPYLITMENGLMGVSKSSQNIIKNEYNSIEYDSINDLFQIGKNGKYGVYDLYGNKVLPIQYDSLAFSGTIINATKDGKELVFDADGNIKKDYEYTSFMPTKSNNYYITTNSEKKYGVVDNSGGTLIDNKYSYIEYIFDKYFIYTENGKTGIIDYTGRKILENKYDVVQNINGTNIVQATNTSTGLSQLYNKNMEKIIESKNMHIYLKEGYIQVLSNEVMKYVDYDGNIKKSQDIFTDNTIFASQKDGKWGYIDISGNVVIDYIYDMALDINEYGFGAIKKDGKWGVIDNKKQIILEPTYEITDLNPIFIGVYYRKMQDYASYSFVKDI